MSKTTKGPKPQFYTTVTYRVRPDDKERWEQAAREDGEGRSLSQIARGLLNKWADKILGEK